MEIHELIQGHKKCDELCTVELLERFDPLINKYAYKLDFEDTKSELTLELITVLNKIPVFDNTGQAVNYISRSIRNKYIELSKKSEKSMSNISIEEFDLSIAMPEKDKCTHLALKNAMEKLTSRERSILYHGFWLGYSTNELAEKFEVSRQSIHSIRKKTYEKLKKELQ